MRTMLNNLMLLVYDVEEMRIKNIYEVEGVKFSELLLELSRILIPSESLAILLTRDVYMRSMLEILDMLEHREHRYVDTIISIFSGKCLIAVSWESTFIREERLISGITIDMRPGYFYADLFNRQCKNINLLYIIAEVEQSKIRLFAEVERSGTRKRIKLNLHYIDKAESIEDLLTRICSECQHAFF